MKILLSNDDGVHAPGLRVLQKVLTELADVVTFAPDRNCSGASSSLTLENPLRVTQLDNDLYSVKGTPSDCVHLALNGLLDRDPDLVVAGINAGANLGDDVIYSGTVAAAVEGRYLGCPAIAFSSVARSPKHFDTAGRIARTLVQNVLDNPLPEDHILNINVPDLPYEEIAGLQVTRLGYRHRSEKIVRDKDPGGRDIFWIGPPGAGQDAGEGTDFYAVVNNFVSVTPLQVDLTAKHQMDSLASWISEVNL